MRGWRLLLPAAPGGAPPARAALLGGGWLLPRAVVVRSKERGRPARAPPPITTALFKMVAITTDLKVCLWPKAKRVVLTDDIIIMIQNS